jgi:glycosyltransferase involved in cell wall biosynthesis
MGLEVDQMQEEVLVTAIVSTWNAERFMEGCLEDLLRQSLGERLEIIVIDSASPGKEGEIVKRFQKGKKPGQPEIRYFRTEIRENSHEAFNRAIHLARGKYLTTANTDDRHRADALERMAEVLEEHPEYGIVYADTLMTHGENECFEDTTAFKRHDWPDFNWNTGLSCCLFGAQPLWRKDVHDEVGLFDPELVIAGDHDMFLRIAWKRGAVHLRESLGLFLERPDSNSGKDRRDLTLAEVHRVLAKYRREMPFEEVYPGVDSSEDPFDWAACCFESGNLCALGPYTDMALALEWYQKALEGFPSGHPKAPELRAAFANNSACLLFCMGKDREAWAALRLAKGFPQAEKNRDLVLEARQQGTSLYPPQLAFVSLESSFVEASRLSHSLVWDGDGWVSPIPQRIQVPWDVYLGPNGIPISEGELRAAKSGLPRSQILKEGPLRPGHLGLKILICMYGWEESGGGTILPRDVALSLAARGHEVSVFYAGAIERPDLPSYGVEHRIEQGVDLIGVFNRPSLFLDGSNPSREIDDPKILALFEKVLEDKNPEVVHCFNLHNLGMSLAAAAKAQDKTVIFSSNNYWPLCPRLYLFHEDLQLCDGPDASGENCANCLKCPDEKAAFALRKAAGRMLLNDAFDFHLAVSDRVREIYERGGADPKKLFVLQQQPKSLDAIWKKTGRDRLENPRKEGPLRVGFIGSLLPHKGPQVLLEAIRGFLASELEVHFFGHFEGPFASYLQAMSSPGLCNFHGAYHPEELPHLLSQVDLVVVPSVWEDCAPFVVAEALAARAPVLGSRIGGIPDFIEEGITGLLFSPGDAEALHQELRRLIQSPQILRGMQKAIQAPRGFDAYLDHLCEVYELLLNPSLAEA